MNIRESAAEFTIYVFASDIDRGAGIKVALSQAGYDAYFFESKDVVLSRIKDRAPHLVIFSTSDLGVSMSDFVQSMLEINPEIRFIVLASPDQYETMASYNSYGLVDLLEDSPFGLSVRSLFAVDRACESLYYQFQNEALMIEIEDLKSHPPVSVGKATQPAQEVNSDSYKIPIRDRINDYLSGESKETIINSFMNHVGKIRCVYLKYLVSVHSLVATHSNLKNGQGMGCHLTSAEAQDFARQITLGLIPPSLEELLTKAFQFKKSRLIPVFVQGHLEGIVAFSSETSQDERLHFEDEVSLFTLAFAHFALEKRLDLIEVLDPVTDVFNKNFGVQKIEEEWRRARRIKQPLSLIKMSLDDFDELEKALGETTRDHLLKTLAQLVKKSSRGHDFVYRSGRNEFALIVPHCSRQGAMVRAERLRRIVESSQMLDNGLKVSLSLGISEYPSLAVDGFALDESASKALQHILGKGGNKLCLSKAPTNHKPDFDVNMDLPKGH